MRSYLIYALGDKYQDIPDLIAKELKTEGEKIIPLLKSNFDYEGINETAHRLSIIKEISKEKENYFYLDILSREINDKVKMEAIKALRYDVSNVNYLVELYVKEKKAEILETIVRTLSYMSVDVNENYINKLGFTLDKKKVYSTLSSLGDSDEILNIVLDDLEKQLSIPSLDEKKTQKFIDSIGYTLNKQSERLYDFYATCLNSTDKFFIDKRMPKWGNYFYMLVDIMADHIIIKNNDMTEAFVSRLESEHGDKVLPLRFMLDLLNKDSSYVYKTYKKYMESNNKKTDFRLSTGIMAILTRIWFYIKEQRHSVYILNTDYYLRVYLKENLDDKWYKDILNANIEMYGYFSSKDTKSNDIYDYKHIYNSLYWTTRRDYDFMIKLLKIVNCKTKDTLNMSLRYLFDTSIHKKLNQTVGTYELENYINDLSHDPENMLLKLANEVYSSNKHFACYRSNEKETIAEAFKKPYEERKEILNLLISELKKRMR